MAKELIRVENIQKYYQRKSFYFGTGKDQTYVKAVDDVSFNINTGETMGFVGESGCGKSTLGRLMLGLIAPDSGKIYFEGQEILSLKGKERQKLKRKIQIVFQDPYASLNPRMRVREIVAEPLLYHEKLSRREMDKRVAQLLAQVGLEPEHALERFPHEFSGGQCQRICIARAIALKPKLVVCDEAVSSLDVSVQAQILNLFRDLQEEFGMAYMFIAHGLNVVKHISNKICVMYLGKIVEMGDVRDVFARRLHPYTEALFSAIPIPDPTAGKRRVLLEGDVPSPINPPPGCRFHTRCPAKKDVCSKEEPQPRDMGNGHQVSCHLY